MYLPCRLYNWTASSRYQVRQQRNRFIYLPIWGTIDRSSRRFATYCKLELCLVLRTCIVLHNNTTYDTTQAGKKRWGSYSYDCPDPNRPPSRLRALCLVHPGCSNVIHPNPQTAHCRASGFRGRRPQASSFVAPQKGSLAHACRDAWQTLWSHSSGPKIVLRTTHCWMMAGSGSG